MFSETNQLFTHLTTPSKNFNVQCLNYFNVDWQKFFLNPFKYYAIGNTERFVTINLGYNIRFLTYVCYLFTISNNINRFFVL